MQTTAVILCGGAGSRLWPASRQLHPKPFMKVGGQRSLLQQAAMRAKDARCNDILIVTNTEYKFRVSKEIDALQLGLPVRYVLEPSGRNTAPAIICAALALESAGKQDSVMLVLAADHLIKNARLFEDAVSVAREQAALGKLALFGIEPTHPETGYGYIALGDRLAGTVAHRVEQFLEKPTAAKAASLVASGNNVWNSGMFCFAAKTLLAEALTHAPNVLTPCQKVFSKSVKNVSGDTISLDADAFSAVPDISIDYAVMEHADNCVVVPGAFGWSDVGSWKAVAEQAAADENGNHANGRTIFIDSSNCYADVGDKLAAVVGVRDLVIVDTPDALLIVRKDASQRVKDVVDTLKKEGHEAQKLHRTVHRPWGTYATLKEEDGYKVKRITVEPGQALSLQYHHKRSEHWVVVQGHAKVQVGDTEYLTEPGEYRYIPLKEKHRLTNIGTEELVLVEVQCGSYTGEDDIVRLQDNYGRIA
jgi:mannose-1-phosphate guanylyltransferase